MSDNSYSQAEAQARSIVEMVAALEVDYDRLEELRDECSDFVSEHPGLTAADASYKWRAENPEDAEELADLEDAAGDCEDQDEAQRRIDEDPLSIEVRTGWYIPGDNPKPDEFKILLCTGGPAVQIVGELDDGVPTRAWIEHQDWFESWQEYHGNDISQDTLLTYCRCFYFGE